MKCKTDIAKNRGILNQLQNFIDKDIKQLIREKHIEKKTKQNIDNGFR